MVPAGFSNINIMFRFEHPELLWLAVIPVALLLLYVVRLRLSDRDWQKWGSTPSNEKTLAGKSRKPRWLLAAWSSTLLLVIAAANPQWGFRSVAVEQKSADIYLVLDISNSMLAEDVAPSRLERARRIALDITEKFRSDRIGLILFAGNAYIQSPLTTDWHAIQLFLNAANPEQAGTQGTSIGKAIRLILKPRPGDETGQGAILVLTDGEDHDDDAPKAVADATEAGWTTYIIGVGTEAGATIPVNIDGQKDVKRDENGKPVKTALNKSLLTELAGNGNGQYYDAVAGNELIQALGTELAGLERNQLEKRSFNEHKSYFQWFLFPAIAVLIGLTIVNYKFDVV